MRAREIIREMQAIGARLERVGDRLSLRAGSRPVPQLLIEQARDAKRELLALLDERSALRPPSEDGDPPTTKKPLAVLGENCPENRETAGGLLTPPNGGLSGGLRSHFADLTVLEDDGLSTRNEDFYGLCRDDSDCNRQASAKDSHDLSKTATQKQNLAVLGNGQVFCGSQPPSPPKAATFFCRDGLSHAAAQQNTAWADSSDTAGCATVGSRHTCCECGTAIVEPVMTWWGGQPCHRDCGETAFRQTKRNRS